MLIVYSFSVLLLSICCFKAVGKAFCDENTPGGKVSQRTSYFPLENPERHIPWVWDSYYNADKNIVEIVSMPRQACHFNTSTWQRFANQFPQYAPQLGDGLFSNVLLSIDSLKVYDYTGFTNPREGLLGKTLNCSFYNDGVLLVKVASLPVNGQPYFSALGSIQIRCPVTSSLRSQSWNYVSLERNIFAQNQEMGVSSKSALQPTIRMTTFETDPFPVCKSNQQLASEVSRGRKDKVVVSGGDKKFGISVCTATSRVVRSALVCFLAHVIQQILGVEFLGTVNFTG